MSSLRLLALGTGDAFSARCYSSCFVVEAQGEWLLIDCPHPIRKMFREATAAAGIRLDIDQISACLLTHLHADHASGVEGVGFFFRYVLGRRVPLIAHPEVAADLWTRNLAASMELTLQEVGKPPVRHRFEEYFEHTPLVEDAPLRFGPFTIRCRRNIHNIPTFALKIEAGGRTLGYSADTAFDPSLIAWLESADLIIHEASGGFLHTPYEKLAALPEPLRAKMRIIHYPDRFDLASSTIEPVREGAIYVV